MIIHAFLLTTIWAVFAPGSAEKPSAVAPVDAPGEPIAFWWDEQAFHAGDKSFEWKKLGVKPTDGRKFKVLIGTTKDRNKIELNGTLRTNAPSYRIGGFGHVGNTNVNMHVEMTAKAKGTVKSYLSAVGATQDYVMVPMSQTVAAGEKATFDITSPRCSSGGRAHYSLTDVDGT